ncbi:very low-density lipoprotein receptor-like [Acanthaster planci]|uniref:Very low-density lipoprotein receptor-like n=1 Tax=Acanthaster planci TaxID=133434 RepID=A0A8B7Z9B2_ACAPL|nr:very low-density lipoprotein receptor-like [Acanthaster planci]
MEVSRLLVLCFLVGVACAINKSERIKPGDRCNKYKEILHTDQLDPSKYQSCGQGAEGECYTMRSKCDSIVDCTNNADEKGCKDEHKEQCEKDFLGKPGVPFKCQAIEGEDPEDRMCILGSWECNGKVDCPNGDDEQNCSGSTSTQPNL